MGQNRKEKESMLKGQQPCRGPDAVRMFSKALSAISLRLRSKFGSAIAVPLERTAEIGEWYKQTWAVWNHIRLKTGFMSLAGPPEVIREPSAQLGRDPPAERSRPS